MLKGADSGFRDTGVFEIKIAEAPPARRPHHAARSDLRRIGSRASGEFNMFKRSARKFLLAVTCVFLLTPMLLAQSLTTGDITGTITDPSGGTMPTTSVVLRNTGTGASQETKTNVSGYYRFSLLAPGSYTVTAKAPNFTEAARTVRVSVGQSNTVDIQLSLSTAAVSVDVVESIVGIQSDNANITSTVNAQQLATLPNSGNDMTFYALITPGVTMSTNGGYGNFETFGLPATSNTFTVNGAVNNDVYLNLNNSGASNLMLGSNAIGEAVVVNNGYSGQYGGLAGSQVNYVTKSGTNTYHGNATYYWNGRAMNANNWFNNQSGDPKPFSNVNMWNTSFGGAFPKQKNKTFFFFDYEGTHILLPSNVQTKIPSPQFATATLKNLTATGQAQAVPFYQNMFNLYAGAVGAGSSVPVPGGGCGTFTLLGAGVPCALQFRSNAGNFTKEYVWSLRVDHNLGPNDKIFVQVQRDNGTQPTYTDPINPIFNAFSPQPEMSGQISENHTFGATVVNQFIFTGQYYSARFGPPDYNAVLAVFPTVVRFSPALFSNMGGEGYNWPQGRNVTQYQLIDDLNWTKDAHNLKFGVNFHRADLSYLSFQTFQQGRITERNLLDFYNGGGTGNFLQQRFPTVNEAPFAFYNLGIYAQDEWRVSPRLTVTATLRADHNSNPVCQVNCFANMVAPFNSLPHNANVPYNQVIQTGLHQALSATTKVIWQPRIGFAWTPKKGDMVVRGGFGIFGDTFPGQVAGPMASNTPNLNSFTINNGKITPGVPGNLFQVASGANQSLLTGFKSGGTVDSITASNPFFQLPNFTTMNSTYKQARYEEWNLEVQKQFKWDLVASANFVGNHGYNEIVQNNGLNGYAPGFVGLPGTAPDRRFLTVNQYMTGGVSNYTGLVLSLRKRMAQGLQFGFSYTYSHALDMVSNAGFDSFDLNTDPSVLFPQNPYNIRQYNYGNADYDVRHYITANYVWDDIFRHIYKKGGHNALVGGWTISGTVFFRTGQPFTVIDSNATGALTGNGYGGTIFGTPVQPGYNGCGQNAINPDTPCLALNQFAPSTSSPTGFGNQTRNNYRGPGYFDTDMSIFKSFKMKGWEAAKLNVGFQFFNLINHPNFDKPVNDIAQGAGVFGTINNLVSAPTSILGSFVGADASVRIIQVRGQFVF
jgi:Carboxypeptidase regulatory-like domain